MGFFLYDEPAVPSCTPEKTWPGLFMHLRYTPRNINEWDMDDWTDRAIHGSSGKVPKYVATDRTATHPVAGYLNPWLDDRSVDHIMVCHSQGCNILMHVINRACSKGGR